MPIRRCHQDGKPGYQFGENGTCYTYEPGNKESRQRALEKAKEQGRAIKASQSQKNV